MNEVGIPCGFGVWGSSTSFWRGRMMSIRSFDLKVMNVSIVSCSHGRGSLVRRDADESRKIVRKKPGKREHHLWKKRDSAGSGTKALNLIRMISEVPNEKDAVYRALDKWVAWEVEFPLIAAAKALRILKKRSQWLRVIQVSVPCPLQGVIPDCLWFLVLNKYRPLFLYGSQVAKWMLSKGQGATMGTYDTLLLAFDVDGRVDEAESLWNMILHAHTRSLSKRLFSRMIALYDHHDMQHEIIEVFADMEELRVRPDEDTVRRVARAFQKIGEDEKRKLVLKRYQCKWKYMHFNGERVRVRRNAWEDD